MTTRATQPGDGRVGCRNLSQEDANALGREGAEVDVPVEGGRHERGPAEPREHDVGERLLESSTLLIGCTTKIKSINKITQ